MILSLLTSGAAATTHANKQVDVLQSFYDRSDCIYFKLVDVPEADPIRPGSPWFAVERSQSGAKDLFASLLAAKLAGKTVKVVTRGEVRCDYATPSSVVVE